MRTTIQEEERMADGRIRGVESSHDTPPLSRDFYRLALHALPQCERKHLLHPTARLRGALDIYGANFACDLRALLRRDGRLARIVVPAEIRLGCDEDERRALAEVRYLGVPLNAGQRPPFDIRHECLQGGMKGRSAHLVLDICETDRRVNGKHDENDVASPIAQWPQLVILLLPFRVPERNLNDLIIKLSVCYVVLKYGGYVRLGRCELLPASWIKAQ
jgi:hypothetical protein